MSKADDNFFARADEHIDVANKQLATNSRGQVSASMMYSVARFNAWFSATEFEEAADMKQARNETIQYFVKEYEKMLTENLDDYINNFDQYMKPPAE